MCVYSVTRCDPPLDRDNSTVVVHDLEIDGLAEYTCDPGFVISSTSSISINAICTSTSTSDRTATAWSDEEECARMYSGL